MTTDIPLQSPQPYTLFIFQDFFKFEHDFTPLKVIVSSRSFRILWITTQTSLLSLFYCILVLRVEYPIYPHKFTFPKFLFETIKQFLPGKAIFRIVEIINQMF